MLSTSSDLETLPSAGMKGELKRTARLGAPLALGELGWMSTYIVDALMIGHMPHSALSISASSLGNTIYYAIAFVVVGMMTGIETLVAQSFGGRDRVEGLRFLAQSMWFVVVGTPLVMMATLASLYLLPGFGVSAEIVGETSRYLHALVWSTAPLMLYMALRRYLQAVNKVILIAVSLLTANLVNAAGDWAFLFGHLGFSPMGIAGSGWATVVVRFYMVALLIVGFCISLRQDRLRLSMHWLRLDLARLYLLGRIGWPIAIEYLTDFGFSTWMSIVCARLGTTMLAAHQVVLDLDAFVYMVPLGLSYATTIRVGQTAGGRSYAGVRRSAKASLILAMGYIAIAASLFAGLPNIWAGLYTNDPVVVAAAAPIFLICGILQIGDAASVILSHALIGLGDSKTPFMANAGFNWIIGAPLSYWLAFHSSLGLKGLWIGRAVAALLTGLFVWVAWRRRVGEAQRGEKTSFLTVLQTMPSGLGFAGK